MSTLEAPKTKGLGAGGTKRLGGGPSRATGGRGGYSQTRNRRTGGMTTTSAGTKAESNDWLTLENGTRINIKPKELMTKHSKEEKVQEESEKLELDASAAESS